MKIQCPEGVCSLSIGGEEFTVNKHGVAELPDTGDYLSLLPAGFSVIPPEQASETGKKPK